jgi:hypothetical protein
MRPVREACASGRRGRRRMKTIASIAAAVVFAASAHAQSNRTFVSGLGSDASLCSLSAPCRSFAHALTLTNAGGEITVLDPAGYGPVTINKAISIVNDGVGEAGVTTSVAGDAITISVGTNDVVNLRGLTLVGGGVGTNGISFTSGGTLSIQRSVVRGFANNGIFVTSAAPTVSISDTVFTGNAASGVYFAPIGPGSLMVERVEASGHGSYAFVVSGDNAASSDTITSTFADCVVYRNSLGFLVDGLAGTAKPQTAIVNCKIASNFNEGLFVSGATASIAQTTIASNGFGFRVQAAGTLKSFGNNFITDTNNFGSLTPISQQ